jgi:hypothetical protein
VYETNLVDRLLMRLNTGVVKNLSRIPFSAKMENKERKCKISGFHGDYYEECRLLGRNALWILLIDFSEDLIASIITVKTMNDIGTALARTSS